MPRIELNPLNWNLRRRVSEIVTGLAQRFAPPEPEPGAVVSSALGGVQRAYAQARSAPVPPPVVPGTGRPWTGLTNYLVLDRDQQLLWGSRGARYGRASARTGPTPAAYARREEITIGRIAEIHSYTERNGYCWDKADLDARILREDGHLSAADRARRSAFFRNPLRLKPKNNTTLAAIVCNAVEAVLDEIDGFDSSTSELQVANGGGFALQEIIYRPRRLRVVVGPDKAVMVDSETVASLEPIFSRSIAFDIDSDKPFINQGNWGWIDPFVDPATQEPYRKVIFHKGYGDGFARMRGFLWAAAPLYFLKGLSLEKWGILLETYGVATPYLQNPPENNVTDEDQARAEEALGDLGKGIPTTIPGAFGEVKTTPVPASLVPFHQAMVGVINSEYSKLVSGQTLTMEMGGVGSYNAAKTHADQQESVQQIDGRLTATTYRSQLLRYLVEVNAEAWARAFAPYVSEECTPEAVIECVPKAYYDMARELDQPTRLRMFIEAKASGWAPDPAQVYEECSLRRPILSATPPAASANAKTDADPVAGEGAVPPVELTGTDQGVIVTVNEAREDLGLGPLPGGDGQLTIAEFKAKHSGVIADAAAAEQGKDAPDKP